MQRLSSTFFARLPLVLALAGLLLTGFLLAGCGSESADTAAGDSSDATGVQEQRITVGPEGFEPARVELVAGQPARLLFTRTTDQTCATEVKAPGVGVASTDLPLNETVAVEFTPGEAGSYTFACGMDMIEGTLVVTRS